MHVHNIYFLFSEISRIISSANPKRVDESEDRKFSHESKTRAREEKVGVRLADSTRHNFKSVSFFEAVRRINIIDTTKKIYRMRTFDL